MFSPRLLPLLLALGCTQAARNLTFPEGFMFGAATSAYQVEGAWNTSGKGESIWDRMVHTKPSCIADRTTGDVADDSYHKYKEDVKLLKEVGFNHYRFSISWSRILPKGDVSVINQDGIDYYNNLINELLANNITPVATMYQSDLPQQLQDLGGFTSSAFVDNFVDYARVLYTHFGDRVKWWLTFNEPVSIIHGFGDACTPPSVISSGVGDYLAGHNLLKAHARAYHLYDEEFRSKQNGKVSITQSSAWGTPATNSSADTKAAETFMEFVLGWFAHPIHSKEGDYPAIMKERIANHSKEEGLYRSRLPEFDEYWIKYIRGTADFFGLNYYNTWLISSLNISLGGGSIWIEMNVYPHPDPSWPSSASPWSSYSPFGMRSILAWVSKNYNNPPILITENGWSDTGDLNDTMRMRYFANSLAYLLDAVYLDNVTVLGHTAWSIMDNFEWGSGYTQRFGLYHVNFSDPERPRTQKESAKMYTTMIQKRKVPEEYLDKVTQ